MIDARHGRMCSAELKIFAEFTLVLPAEADIGEGRISVLAPIGTGMLGYRMENEFKWPAPSGVRRLKVTGIHGQPEASLAKGG